MPVTYYSGTETRTQDWDSEYRWIGYLSEWFDGGSLTSNVTLAGSDWTIAALRFSARDDNFVSITDTSNAGDNIRINYLKLGTSSEVTLTHTRVNYIDGDWGEHDITLGSQHTRAVNLYGSSNTVTTGSGYVGMIDTDGQSNITVNGDVGFISTGTTNDTFTINGGYVEMLKSRGGSNEVVVNGGNVSTLKLNGLQDSTVIVNDGGRINTLQSNGEIDVVLNGRGEASTIENYEGFVTFTSDTGWTKLIDLQRSSGVIDIGEGGLGILRVGTDIGAGSLDDVILRADGHVDRIRVHDEIGADITLGDGGAGAVRLDNADDYVKTGAGWVEVIATQGGNDLVEVGAGGVSLLRLGNGDDTVKVGKTSVLAVIGGNGEDTIDFSGFRSGVEFSLNEGGAYQSVQGFNRNGDAKGGWFSAISVENLIGTRRGDTFTGNDDDNTFRSGKGNDMLTGLGGDDLFIFSRREGKNTIEDFTIGEDKIEILKGAARFKQLKISQDGDDAVIKFARTTITLSNVDADDLSASDFIF